MFEVKWQEAGPFLYKLCGVIAYIGTDALKDSL